MQKTEAIILKKSLSGEHDQLLTLYTKEFGKIRILGRGTKKIVSKLNPNLDYFSRLLVSFVEGKKNFVLTDSQELDAFFNIKNNSGKIKAAFYISNLVDELIPEPEKDEETWSLLIEALKNINEAEENDLLPFIVKNFEGNFLNFLGYGFQASPRDFIKKNFLV